MRVNPVLRDSVAHVFVDDLSSPVLSDDDQHHLGRVLRVRDGEVVTVSDGAGRWRACEWHDGTLRPVGEAVQTPTPSTRVGVAFVPVKGERNEWAVQKLTEIGVHDIVVLAPTRRSVVRWSDPDKQMRRLRAVAREAAMQSRRVWLPVVSGPTALAQVFTQPAVAVADPTGAALGHHTRLVVVGPEGGFDADEIDSSVTRVSLGDTILRAETATLVAATLLIAHHATPHESTASIGGSR